MATRRSPAARPTSLESGETLHVGFATHDGREPDAARITMRPVGRRAQRRD